MVERTVLDARCYVCGHLISGPVTIYTDKGLAHPTCVNCSPHAEARIAELEAEVERLRNMLNGYGKLDAELAIAERRIEALSRTGAVKVLPRPDAVSMTCGTICLEYEDRDRRDAAYDWLENHAYAPLSAIEPAAPEGQQEAVAWGEFYGGKIVAVSLHKSHHYTVPLYTCPSEQAVTEAMVEAAANSIANIWRTGDLKAIARAALKAAMEAGR